MKLRVFSALLVLVFAIGGAAFAAVKPSPEPGGANQTSGVAGSLKATLFNGQVRLRKMALTKPNTTPDESYTDDASGKWYVLRALASNGTPRVLDMQQFSATIVDSDGVAVAAQPDKVRPMGMVTNIPPGGAWREVVLFQVPPDFKPVKIVLVPTGGRYKAFRITVTAADLPK